MKKYIWAGTLALALFVSIIHSSALQAQISIVCPVGYTCTPNPTYSSATPSPASSPTPSPTPTQSNCPIGYTCKANAIVTPLNVTTDATAVITGAPKLNLTYDSNNRESQLAAAWDVTINGGSQGVNVLRKFFSWSLADQNGNNVWVNNAVSEMAPTGPTGTYTDAYGQAYWSIPAGQSMNFIVTGRVNPQTLFAGTYTASLFNFVAYPGNAKSGQLVGISVGKNQTNAVTVVGEVSPYIISVTSPAISGQNIVILGQRFNGKGGDNIYVDGSITTGFGPQNDTQINFTLPSLSNGFHTLYVNQSVTGNSNIVGFQVQNAGSSCTYTFSTNFGIGSTGPDVVALQTFLINNGYDIPTVSAGLVPKGAFGILTKNALIAYQTAHGLQATGYVDVVTRSSLNSCNGPGGGTTSGVQVMESLDPNSPPTQIVQISQTAVTQNVALAVFDLQSQNGPSTLSSLNVTVPVNMNGTLVGPGKFFTNMVIKVAGQTYAENYETGQVVTFNSLRVGLPANVSIPVTVYGSIAADASGSLSGSNASVALPLSGIYAVDANNNPVQVNQGPIVGTLSGSTITFVSGNSPQVSNMSTAYGPKTCDTSLTNCMQNFTFNYTVTAGINSVYIPANASSAISSSFISGCANLVVKNFSDSNSNGDSSTYFYVAPGQSKTFTAMYNVFGSAASGSTFGATSLEYGFNTANTLLLQPAGIQNNLKAVLDIGGGSGCRSMTTPGVAGNLTISQDGSIYSGTTLSLQAGPSDMYVNSIVADFNARPWLYFSSFSLVNKTTGQVLVPATPFGQNNFTEIIPGSDYNYVFGGLNLIVPHGQVVNLVLTGQAISGMSQNASVVDASVRSIDGTGVTRIATTNGSGSSGMAGGSGAIVTSIDSQNPGIGLSPAAGAMLSARLISTGGTDKAGAWGNFHGDGVPDFTWQATLTLNSAKTIKSILQSSDARGLAGFTSQAKVDDITLYPLVVSYNGQQLNSAYDQTLGTYQPGTYTFTINGDNAANYNSSKWGITFYFTDGTYVTTWTNGSVQPATQLTTNCPAGYICNVISPSPSYSPTPTPSPSSVTCPAGYICNVISPSPSYSPTPTPYYYPTPTYSPSPSATPYYSPTYSPTVTVAAPTATFTIEGQHSYAYTPGQYTHYAWSGSNADTYSSSYTATGGSICGGGPWIANTSSGSNSAYISSAYAGCVWTVTYTARNSQTGMSSSATVQVSVNPLTTAAPSSSPTPTPSGSPSAYSGQSQTASVSDVSNQPAPGACYVFTNDLDVGADVTGGDARALANMLVAEGVADAGTPFGLTYNSDYVNAVIALQTKLGINPSGFFGPITRAKVNSLDCAY